MLSDALVVVDLETTGCDPERDRITEIAIVSIGDGAVRERWTQLLDPGRSIPPSIQVLTGITDAMVAGQPAFEDLADVIHARLAGSVFVAHNARFDYGFLRHALRRSGLAMQGPVLCTLRLSRRLFPQERHHNLDALIERHGLSCAARHRALGDAEATWGFVEAMARRFPRCELEQHIEALCRPPVLPPGLDPSVLDELPDSPGVYLLFDAQGAPLHVGAAIKLRAGVMARLGGEQSRSRTAKLLREATQLRWQCTAGELAAHLRALRLVRDLAPRGNRRPRARAELPPWPWPGPVAVPERDPHSGREEVQLIDRWRHVGSCRDEQELGQALLSASAPAEDAEVAALLARQLLRNRRLRIISLPAPPHTARVLSQREPRV